MTGRVVGIVQARLGSTRLPGKVLADIAGRPMLSRVMQRLKRAGSLQARVVATSHLAQDDPIADLCRQEGFDCYRGEPQDLLDRYYQAAQQHAAEVIVRVTADCPLLDPELVDHTVTAFHHAGVAFAANRLPRHRTYPIGLDTEVCSLAALQQAWREATEPHQREHVMPFIYEHPERFSNLILDHSEDLGDLRWTVDTAQDLEFVRAVYARMAPREDFGWLEVLALVRAAPELAAINAHVAHRTERDFEPRDRGAGAQPGVDPEVGPVLGPGSRSSAPKRRDPRRDG
jgi:spore coat polysaccharide biosynthesis protein SpsF